ncbi:MAG: CAP domain-containing protein [Pseudomonadota bacterium]
MGRSKITAVFLMAAVAALALTGCSARSSQPLLSLNGSDDANNNNSIWSGSLFGGGTSSAPQRRGASAHDKAPADSWRSASRKTDNLAKRDYDRTKAQVARAQRLINAYRQENGLPPLRLDPKLTLAAKAHSTDLAKWDRISHYGSDGSNPWQRVQKSGYKAKLAAENVGTGQASIDEVFKGWQESEAHDRNLLLKGAQHMGLALVVAPETKFKTFWTLVLGAPL